MDELRFESALRKALIADMEREYARFLDPAIETPPHTVKYLRFERKILKDPIGYVHKLLRPAWKTVLQKAAMIIIVFVTIFGLIMAIPPARAFVFSVVEKFINHNEHITEVGGYNEQIGDCDITYLPEGFSVIVDDDIGMIICSNGESNITLIYDYTSDNMGVSLNNEDAYTKSIKVGKYSATLYQVNTEEYLYKILWYDEELKIYFLVVSDIDVDELIKVAESVQLKLK